MHDDLVVVLAVQEVGRRTVRHQVPAEKAWLGAVAFDYHRTGAVPEQDAGGAVLPVGEPAERVATDQKDALHAALHELHGGDQPVDEPRAGRIEIHRATRQAQVVLDDR